MSKLSRQDLKGIVKECLLEILSEGLHNSFDQIVESKKTRKISESQYRKKNVRNSEVESLKQRMNYLDSIKVGQEKQADNSNVVKNRNFDQKIERTAASLTSDPILSEIFKDTASTTLQEQLSAETRGGTPVVSQASDAASLKMSKSDPMELFGGEAASKWATLAFAEK